MRSIIPVSGDTVATAGVVRAALISLAAPCSAAGWRVLVEQRLLDWLGETRER